MGGLSCAKTAMVLALLGFVWFSLADMGADIGARPAFFVPPVDIFNFPCVFLVFSCLLRVSDFLRIRNAYEETGRNFYSEEEPSLCGYRCRS